MMPNETLAQFRRIATVCTFESDRYEDYAFEYQLNPDDLLLAALYVKVYKPAFHYMKRYYSISQEDKEDISVECLYHALNKYDPSKSKFLTFYINCIAKKAWGILRDQNCNKGQHKSGVILGIPDFLNDASQTENIDRVEVLLSLNSLDQLTESEVQYCRVLIEAASALKDAEVAASLGVTWPQVKKIRASLISKLSQNGKRPKLGLF